MANNKLINLAKVSPVLLGASFVAAQAQPAIAQTSNSEQETLNQIEQYNNQGNQNLNQVNSVFELQDVSPDDWAFEALQNLVERYGCIAGYPDGTFRGNQAMTRYEFAAGLNACLQQIERLIAESKVSPEDLETIKRLQEEFDAELTALGSRVDNLEGRVNTLEEQQFSTTTKLTGSVEFTAVQPFGDNKAGFNPAQENVDENTGFLYTADLNFDASFTGEDKLRVRLRAGEGEDFLQNATHANGPNSSTADLLRLDSIRETEGSVDLNDLYYQFPVGDAGHIRLGANSMNPGDAFQWNYGSGTSLSDFIDDGNIYIKDGGFTDVFNPAVGFVNPGQNGVGISSSWNLGENFAFNLGYTVEEGNSRNPEAGIFRDFTAASSLDYLGENFDVGLGFGFTQAGDKGTPIDDLDQFTGDVHGAVRFSPQTELGAYVSYVEQESNDVTRSGWGFGANFALKDLGKEGSQLNIAFSSPPLYTEDTEAVNELNRRGLPVVFTEQETRAFVGEVSYDFPVNDNITITPGVLAVFNPDYDRSGRNLESDNQFAGVIETSFEF